MNARYMHIRNPGTLQTFDAKMLSLTGFASVWAWGVMFIRDTPHNKVTFITNPDWPLSYRGMKLRGITCT